MEMLEASQMVHLEVMFRKIF